MSKINIDSFSFVEQIIDYSCVDNWINTCCSRYSSPFFLGKFCSWEYVSSTYVKYPVITEDGLWAKERLYCPPPFAASILEHGLRRVHVPASGCGSWAEVEEGRRSMRRAKGSLHVATCTRNKIRVKPGHLFSLLFGSEINSASLCNEV